MIIENYQTEAARTLIEKPDFEISDRDMMLLWNAIGLGGETDELTEAIAASAPSSTIAKEFGDCFWYAAALCTKLEIDFAMLFNSCGGDRIGFADWLDAIATLNAHAGRVTEYFKKGIFHQHGIEVDVAARLVQKYLAILGAIANYYGLRVKDILELNIIRLRDRYPEGFTAEASINRSQND